MSLLQHAENELRFAGLLDSDDEMQGHMNDHILGMIKEFAKEGHSGFSAGYAISQLTRLLNFLPLSPLTGEDEEWEEVSEGLWQNKRCSRVFKNKDGAYDIDGYYFVDQDGTTFTNEYCCKPVIFPYVPKHAIKIEIYHKRQQ
jgi:hypothetical protein